MDVIVDLPAVRPARLALALVDEPLADEARELRPYLRGAHVVDLPGGIRLAFELEHGLHLGGVHHLQLLNHPRVYEQLARWLTGSPAGGGPAAVPARAAG